VSLIGIDLGSSAIKVGAYAVDGTALANAHRPVPGYHPAPGHSEVDVLESRAAFAEALQAVATAPELKADPPVAISFSSSGREVFPVSADGTPLGRCLMTSDTRVPSHRPRASPHGPRESSPLVVPGRPRSRGADPLVHELA